MKLSSESRIVRWAYWLDDTPSRTDLCRLFWRIVLLTPFKALAAAVIVPCIGLGWLAYQAIEGIKAGGRWLYRKASKRKSTPRPLKVKPPSIVIQHIKDWKSKTCTLIEIE